MGGLLAGIALGLSLAAPLGPVNILAVRSGVATGFKGAFLVGVGALTSDFLYTMFVLVGVAPLLGRLPWLRPFTWTAGALALAYLGAGAIRAALRRTVPPAGEARVRTGSHYGAGFLAAFLSPFGIMWYLTAGGAVISRAVESGGLAGGLVFVGGFLGGISLWFSGLAAAVHLARRAVGPRTLRAVSFVSGLALLGFAGWLGRNAWLLLSS